MHYIGYTSSTKFKHIFSYLYGREKISKFGLLGFILSIWVDLVQFSRSKYKLKVFWVVYRIPEAMQLSRTFLTSIQLKEHS